MRISDWSSDVCSSDLHPLGKAPVIVDTDADDRVVAETGAILEYLVEKGDGRLGTPAHRESALRYRHFLHYAEGSLMPPLLVKLVLGRVPVLGKTAQRQIGRAHVCTPVHNAHLVCRVLLDKQKA